MYSSHTSLLKGLLKKNNLAKTEWDLRYSLSVKILPKHKYLVLDEASAGKIPTELSGSFLIPGFNYTSRALFACS